MEVPCRSEWRTGVVAGSMHGVAQLDDAGVRVWGEGSMRRYGTNTEAHDVGEWHIGPAIHSGCRG
jgi:hypothetical protein